MGHYTTIQPPFGGNDLLAIRRRRTGATEIVYDDGVARRIVWRVIGVQVSDDRLGEALRIAARQLQIVPALCAELKKRAIAVERIHG